MKELPSAGYKRPSRDACPEILGDAARVIPELVKCARRVTDREINEALYNARLGEQICHRSRFASEVGDKVTEMSQATAYPLRRADRFYQIGPQ